MRASPAVLSGTEGEKMTIRTLAKRYMAALALAGAAANPSTTPRCASRRWLAWLRCVFLLALPLGSAAPAWADDCGMANMRPCLITERRPSCDINLAESQGMCVRPACGTENARPCSAFERTTMDLVLKVPTPQPCDANLKVDGGVCVHPPCGRDGQAPCDVFQRLPSCDLNLAETPAGCVHPNCGRLGEAPCGIAVKRATFGPCDVNLIARNGQCVRPGVPGASAGGGATQGQVNAAVPVTPPRALPPPPPPPTRTAGQAAPPPPPPPQTNPTPATGTAAAGGAMETDTDRMGGDMYGFAVAQPDPAMCQASCNYNAQCVGWTYVKPGIKGPAATCFLKNAPTTPTRNTCCVSGAKGQPSFLKPLR
jgi:PAN domain